jgi:hypothetical protein
MATQSQTVKPGEPDPSLEYFIDDKPKLKSVFDNVRNYAICATLFAVSAWFKKGALEAITPQANQSHYVEQFISSSFLVAGIILTLLNMIQTYAILGPPLVDLHGWLEELAAKATEKKRKWLLDIASESARGIGVMVLLILLFMIIALVRASYFSTSIGHK